MTNPCVTGVGHAAPTENCRIADCVGNKPSCFVLGCEQFDTDCRRQIGARYATKGGRCSGEWHCQSPISSGNMPKKPCFGALNPKPRKRSNSCLSLCAHGRRRPPCAP